MPVILGFMTVKESGEKKSFSFSYPKTPTLKPL